MFEAIFYMNPLCYLLRQQCKDNIIKVLCMTNITAESKSEGRKTSTSSEILMVFFPCNVAFSPQSVQMSFYYPPRKRIIIVWNSFKPMKFEKVDRVL